MSDEYGPNFVSLTDEDGNIIELEHIDTIELKGAVYMAFFPAKTEEEEAAADAESEEEEEELIILKVQSVDGEDQLVTLDSEDELNEVYDKFMEELFAEED